MLDNVDVAAGVIDTDQNGPVKLLLVNYSQKRFNITKYDPIAQIIFERASTLAICFLSFFEESLTATTKKTQMIPTTAHPTSFIDNTHEILPKSPHIIPIEDSSIHIILDMSPLIPTTYIIPPDTTPPFSAPISHTPP